MDLALEGKRALVTGSTAGIGRAVALRLAEEGCSVVVHGRDQHAADEVADAVGALGAPVEIVLGSLTSAQGAEAIADAALAAGPLDIVVNNAGGRNKVSTQGWGDLSPEVWLETYQLNALSPAIVASRALAGMRERNWGRIINISSVGSYVPRPDAGEYGSAKAALNQSTVSLSLAVAGTGITANAISPGGIDTRGLRTLLTRRIEQEQWQGTSEEVDRLAVAAVTPSTVGRIGQPEEIAAAVAFLASPLAAFINGVNLHVDGGRALV
jgi:3-oxoacyl-[acyl-carrier protein] reductase